MRQMEVILNLVSDSCPLYFFNLCHLDDNLHDRLIPQEGSHCKTTGSGLHLRERNRTHKIDRVVDRTHLFPQLVSPKISEKNLLEACIEAPIIDSILIVDKLENICIFARIHKNFHKSIFVLELDLGFFVSGCAVLFDSIEDWLIHDCFSVNFELVLLKVFGVEAHFKTLD